MSLACTFDFGFCVGPAVPDEVKDVKGFLAWAKTNPSKGELRLAGRRLGATHFIGVLLSQAGGVEL